MFLINKFKNVLGITHTSGPEVRFDYSFDTCLFNQGLYTFY